MKTWQQWMNRRVCRNTSLLMQLEISSQLNYLFFSYFLSLDSLHLPVFVSVFLKCCGGKTAQVHFLRYKMVKPCYYNTMVLTDYHIHVLWYFKWLFKVLQRILYITQSEFSHNDPLMFTVTVLSLLFLTQVLHNVKQADSFTMNNLLIWFVFI